jgi:alanine racemase
VEEGLQLREAGVRAPILVLSELPAGSEKDALGAELTPTVFTDRSLEAVAEAGAATGRTAAVHVKVDTGMHRAGLYPPEAAPAFARRVVDSGVELGGVWTHFARAEEDETTTRHQLGVFQDVLTRLRADGLQPGLVHAANSAAAILYPETFDLVRIGIALYGLDPGGGLGERAGIRPALSWRSAVSVVRPLPAGEAISYGHRYRLERDCVVATVPVGYADGYRRALSSRSDVLIRGRRRRVAGTVTMDQLVVDCGEDDVQVGDEVVLIGRQGEEEIAASELAEMAGTIDYEIACGIGPRVPRRYRP